MKKLKIISILILVFTFWGSQQVWAQKADVQKTHVTISINVGGEILLLEGESTRVYTPSDVFVRTYIFTQKLSKEDLIKIQSIFGPYANCIKGIKGVIEETGESVTGIGFLNKAGKLTIQLHSNGAGTDFPVGWF
jgi:hypothetical protein